MIPSARIKSIFVSVYFQKTRGVCILINESLANAIMKADEQHVQT